MTWPRYQRVGDESDEEIAEIRANYCALVAMVDEYFGKLLDYFDEHNLWQDTALIVTTDHGFLLGEHDWWAKSRMPFYNEISHIPLLIYHPDIADCGGERRRALTQNIDLMPTFLQMHGAQVPATVTGHSLLPVMKDDKPIRDVALYGQFGAATNVTNGRYTYFRYPKKIDQQQLYEYTLMPTHQNNYFAQEEFEGAEIVYDPFSFMKGYPVLKIPARPHPRRGQGSNVQDTVTALYDLQTDPGQTTPIDNLEVETMLVRKMVQEMKRHEAPDEAYQRFDIDPEQFN